LIISCSNYHKEYYDNGKLKIIGKTDRNGNWIGTVKKFYNNGQIESECNYSKGLPNGTINGYDTSGILNYKAIYVRGKMIGHSSYDKTGKMISGINYLNPNTPPKLNDFHIRFTPKEEFFKVGDTALIDIVHDSILKFQIILMFSNGSVYYNTQLDSFNFSFTPKRKGKSIMFIDVQMNDTLRINVGKREFQVLDN
jgi:hypothetical protein